MLSSPVVDGFIIVVMVLSILGGWRLGALGSILSTTGVLAGLVCGMALVPAIMNVTDSSGLRFLFALGTVVLLVAVGNLVGGKLGSSLRGRLERPGVLFVDSLIGSVFQVATAVLVIWLISVPMASALSGPIGQGIRESRILGFVDHNMPAGASRLPAKLSALLSDSGLPPLVSPFETDNVAEIEAPRIEVEDKALVESLRPSVVHVLGDAHRCRRRLLGSGFVTKNDYVITNAHVVAGTDMVRLDTSIGMKDAQVVYYNPDVDIAVLYSPGLGLPPLAWSPTVARSGDDAIVMGFPNSGPFEAAPARIRDRLRISGPDIYAASQVEREAYTARGSIRQGNSGGPMLNSSGQVIGVVFGASIDDSDTGYALTAAEVLSHIGDVTTHHTPVNTQECVSK